MELYERGKAKQSVSLWQHGLSALGSCSCKNHDLPLCQHVSRRAKALPCRSGLAVGGNTNTEKGQTVEKNGKSHNCEGGGRGGGSVEVMKYFLELS